MPLTVGTLFPWRFSCSWLCSEMQSKSLWEGKGKGQHAQGGAGSSVRCPNTSEQRALWLSGKESDDVAADSGPGTQPEKGLCLSSFLHAVVRCRCVGPNSRGSEGLI